MISNPVTGIIAVWLVPPAGEPTMVGTWVATLWVTNVLGISEPAVGASAVVAVPVPNPPNGVLVGMPGKVVPTSVGAAPRFAALAAVNRIKMSAPNKNIFFMRLTP